MVEGEYEEEDRERDKGHFPPDALPEAQARVVDHDSPGGFALDADAEEADKDFRGHRGWEADRKRNQDNVGDVGEDVAEDDAAIRVPQDACCCDVGAIAVFNHFGADIAADADPCGESDAQIEAEQSLADHHGNGEDKEQSGHGGYGGAEPDHEAIDAASEIPAEASEDHAEGDGDQRGDNAHMERDARALNEALGYVAAEVIAAQQEEGLAWFARPVLKEADKRRWAVAEVFVDFVVCGRPVGCHRDAVDAFAVEGQRGVKGDQAAAEAGIPPLPEPLQNGFLRARLTHTAVILASSRRRALISVLDNFSKRSMLNPSTPNDAMTLAKMSALRSVLKSVLLAFAR